MKKIKLPLISISICTFSFEQYEHKTLNMEFGMTWNKLTDTGGLGLGENIKLIANIQIAELIEETDQSKL